ncbi:hypothetical protein FJTKL_01285 [Diaporthe vaccinii]|uniref:Uncharacterized protein n=1 Tax=Diaporthe vaccinii TaxID=105482 RepID=A0ABR4E1F2_9PEZI
MPIKCNIKESVPAERHFLVGEVELGLLADVDLLGGGTGLLHLEAAGEEVVAAGEAGAGGDLLGDGQLVAAGVVVGELGDGPGAGRVLAGAVGDLGQLAVGGQHGRALDGGGLAGADLDNSEGVAVGGMLLAESERLMLFDGTGYCLRALGAVGNAGGREVRDVEDQVGRGHRGGEGEEGTSGELHLDGCLGCLVRMKRVSWLLSA